MATRIIPVAVLQRLAGFRALLAVSVALGVLLGVGAALAHDPFFNMDGGLHVYYTGKHQQAVGSPLPDYSFYAYHMGTADADYPDATSFDLDITAHYNGWVPDPAERAKVEYGVYRMYDADGQNRKSYYGFVCDDVHLYNSVQYTQWEFSPFTPTNPTNKSFIMDLSILHGDIMCGATGEWHTQEFIAQD